MEQAALYNQAGWERALRVPAIGYRLRPWSAGSAPSLLCLAAALAVCAALLLAPLLCLAHCMIMSARPASHAHHHGAPALGAHVPCALQGHQPSQPAQQPEAPLPRAVYELLPQTAALAALVALVALASPSPALAFSPQHKPAPPKRPPII